MAAADGAARRLFVRAPLQVGAPIELDRAQAHYLLSVLRLASGSDVVVFNGRDGEWRARLQATGRRSADLEAVERLRHQTDHPDVILLFAPLKHARLDYLVQKAAEMGAGTLRPILTRRTVPSRINRERMEANLVEAAEQCGLLCVPALLPETGLAEALDALDPGRLLVFCDEEAAVADPLEALARAGGMGAAVVIGPEGGFDPLERRLVLERPNVCRLSLGPRILRADTAAVAALAVVQAVRGDWR